MSNDLEEKGQLITRVAKETGFGRPQVYSDVRGKYNKPKVCTGDQLDIINTQGGAAYVGIARADEVIALGGHAMLYPDNVEEKIPVKSVMVDKKKGYDKVIADEVQSLMMKRNMQNGGMGA